MGRAILIVEDDDIVRDFMLVVLRSEGREVLTAESVKAAREIIFARPDAENLSLIIDVVLRQESGVAFAQELIQRYPRFNVLLVSGFTDDMVLTEPEDIERIAFLPKPFTKKELMGALEKFDG
ncbi:MAG: response regulator [Verrucomicrobiota bacterium]